MTQAVSILIATRNRAESLSSTLESFAKLDLPAGVDVELIVVDNGSTDQTLEILENTCLSFPIRILQVKEPGKSRCLNVAACAAKGQVFLFTDDDVHPDSQWIGQMTRPVLEGIADAAQGGIRLADYLLQPWLTTLQRAWLAERAIDTTVITPTGSLTGANMCISRAAFNHLGGLDENLGPGALGLSEESLLALQLNAAGYRTIYVEHAEVEHRCPIDRISRRSLLKSASDIGRSLGYIYHHWLRMPVTMPKLRVWKHLAELWTWRLLHPGIFFQPGLQDRELTLVRDVELWKQYVIECRQPSKYVSRGNGIHSTGLAA